MTPQPFGTRPAGGPADGHARSPARRPVKKPTPVNKPSAGKEPAGRLPVAVIAVDISLSHLDRSFDYLVPAELDTDAQPGARVRVRFAGRLADGFVLERREISDHGGRLGYLERVVSPEPVLTGEIAELARAVADRYVGSLADVLRLAIPPRHARAEASVPPTARAEPVGQGHRGGVGPRVAPDPGGWSAYPAGQAFLTAVSRGKAARAVWQAAPGEDWPARLAEAARAAHAAGRGALLPGWKALCCKPSRPVSSSRCQRIWGHRSATGGS